jgi:hypothetical protein
MKKYFLILFLIFHSWAEAQKIYTDYRPRYKEWNRRYILDKIEYTKTRTIFYFRYLSSQWGDNLSFFGAGHPSHWCLENLDNPAEVYHMIEIRNLKRNGKVVYEVLDIDEASFTTSGAKPETFTCEVHFPRLPKNMTKANFLEGYAAKHLTNHFHCLNVKIKNFDDEDLGNENDMIAKIQKFHKKHNPSSLFDIFDYNPVPKPRNNNRPPITFNFPKKQNKDIPNNQNRINQERKKTTPNNQNVIITQPKPKPKVEEPPKPDVSGAKAQEGEIIERQ